MKKLTFAVVSAVALLSAPAMAADMPSRAPVYKAAPPALFNWSGFYVGGYAGAMSAKSQDVSGAGPEIKLDGGVYGGLTGVNWQTGNFVWGFEADGGQSNANHGSDGNNFDNYHDRFVGNLRVRAGWASDRVLFFVAGGAAFTDEKICHSGSICVSRDRTGYTVGAGIDWAATQNLIFRIEYLYAGFSGDKSFNFDGDVHTVNYDNQHTVRAAAIWKFDWGKGPVVAKY